MFTSNNDTIKFIEAIKPSIKRGLINTDGYYSFASFTYRSYIYIITPADAFLTRVIKQHGTGNIEACVAPHKHNKDGLRDRYTFNTNYLLFNRRQITVDVARLNAVLLIPGAMEKLTSGDDYEVNHKAILNNTYRSQLYKTSLNAVYKFRKLIRTIDIETGKLIDPDKAREDVYDEYSDVCFDILVATDNLKKSPVMPRDNRVANLEVCKSEENKAHFRAVREFIALSTSPYYNIKIDASIKRVEAKKAYAYINGTMSRQDFISYLISLPDVNHREAEIVNSTKEPSKQVLDLLNKGIVRAMLSL